MNQQELEALLAQIAPNNDPRRLVFTEATETVEQDVPGATQYEPPTKQKRPVKVLQWTDPGTGQTLRVQQSSDGPYTKTFQGIDPKQQGAPATTPAQQAQEEQGTEIGSREETDAQGKTTKVRTYQRPDGTTYERTDTVQAAPAKPTIAPGTAGQPAVQYVPDPDHPGQVKAVPISGAPAPPAAPAQQLSVPSDQMWIVSQKPGQPPEFVKNPNYIKPSRIMPDPGDPTKLINVTHDDQGNVISVPVTGTTTIKPVDLPVLQAKYGEIAQGLGSLAADLNGKFARGEITAQQRSDAFQAAKQQAEVQISELNGILSNSRAVWGQQIEQRGQTLSDTAGRRTYAGNVLGQAISYGTDLGRSAGPGHGKEITGGMLAMMEMGQRLATGMGGLRDSPEIQMPAALQQAQGIGLPGYGAPGGSVSGPPGITSGPPGAPPSGISDTTDRGGVPRVMTPASATNAPSALVGAPGSGFGLGSNISLPGGAPAPGGPSPIQTLPGGAPGTPPPIGTLPGGAPGAPLPIQTLPGGAPHPVPETGNWDPGPGRGVPETGNWDVGPSRGVPETGPFVGGMQQQLLAALGFGGSPVAAGGQGLWDPDQEMASMVGDGSDPEWAAAVQAAARDFKRPAVGSGVESGYRRFG